MHQLNTFVSRNELDEALAKNVSDVLAEAVELKGSASLAVSGGSTPKGFFEALSSYALPWRKIFITLADERWVDINSDASNTRLVHENLLKNNAVDAKFFHLKQGDDLSEAVLAELSDAAKHSLLPLDVLILGMGEDGHTASIFPCSEQLEEALDEGNDAALMKVVPTTAPHERITFTFASLIESKNTILHIVGENKKVVLDKALSSTDAKEQPIRAFLHHPTVNTQVFWAE